MSTVESLHSSDDQRTHLHFGGLVVAAVLILVGRAVTVPEEALEAILSPQLADDLVKCLAVERVVVHRKGRVADGRQQCRVCVLDGGRTELVRAGH